MEQTQTNLRQSKTAVIIEGILSSMNLEETTTTNGSKAIKGSLVIKVDETNSIPVNVFCSEFTSKGEKNKAYDGIKTVKNEYKSIADVGEGEADRIRTKADFNTYKNQNGIDVVNYKSNFFNRVTRELNPQRNFKCEAFIKAKSWETDSEGNDTGRLKIRGIVPAFGGTINILDMICPVSNEYDENFAQDADNLFEVGNTYELNGEIVNARVEKKKAAALGKLQSEVEYKNELIITGSGEAYPEATAYPANTINLAIQEYETAQSQKKDKDEVPFGNNKPSASASGRTVNF